MVIDGHDDALLGVSDVWDSTGNRALRAVYSGELIVATLVKRDGMDEDDAMEFIDFNISGAYVGPTTPIIVWAADIDDLEDYDG